MSFNNLEEVLEFIQSKRKSKRQTKPKIEKIVKKEIAKKEKKKQKTTPKVEQKEKPKKRTYLWKEKQQEIVSLYKKGYNVNQISRMLNVSYNTVVRSLWYAGIKVENIGRQHKVLRKTLELLCEYIMNPSHKQFVKKHGKVFGTRIQEFFRNTGFPRPRFLNKSERKEIVKILKEFLERTNKEIYTIDDLKPIIDKVKVYKKMWKGRVKEIAPAIWNLYSQGYDIKEISEILNVSERSIRDVVYKKRYLPKQD